MRIDQDLCIGCGSCESACPKCFKLKDGISQVVAGCDPKNCDCDIDDVIAACPVSAITK